MKKVLQNIAVAFDKLPDNVKKAFYYLLYICLVNLIALVQQKWGGDVLVSTIFSALMVEVVKFFKNLGVDTAK